MSDTERLEALRRAAAECRRQQRAYFGHPSAVQSRIAKDAEARLDAMIEEMDPHKTEARLFPLE